MANPQPKRDAAKALYVANAATKRVKARIQYQTHPHVFRAAVKAYYERRKDTVNRYRRGKYSLKEPKARMKAELAKMLQQNVSLCLAFGFLSGKATSMFMTVV